MSSNTPLKYVKTETTCTAMTERVSCTDGAPGMGSIGFALLGGPLIGRRSGCSKLNIPGMIGMLARIYASVCLLVFTGFPRLQ
jgi:hypothetical protein